ncbi:MAG: hypothetical protein IJ054_06250 [Lachnospiraceae bacterium]|nr:hypothetical protein [Lachnospiraceae bacterium]
MSFFDKLKDYLNEEPEDDIDEAEAEAKRKRQAEKKDRKEKRKARKKAADENEDIINLEKELNNVKATRSSENEKAVVKDVCEQLVDVSYHMEDMKQEYKVVTDYLVDIQRIDELPIQMANDIIDTAKSIELLEKDKQKYLASENLLSMEQYNRISMYEDDVLKTVKELNEMEMRDGLLKSDMGYLEGEKDDLEYLRDEYADSITRIRGIMIGVFLVCFVAIGVLLIYALTKRESVTVYALGVGAMLMIAFAIAYAKYLDLNSDIKDINAKHKKAVSLLNKVKVKYINNVNAIDYLYEKFGVNSCKELEYQWEQYNTMVSDALKYSRANKDLRFFKEQLIEKLKKIGVSDAEVWTRQTNALIDRREMVEITHSLNVRRQKLREKLATCDKIKNNATTALKAAIEEKPELKAYVAEILESYRLSLEN